MGMGETILDQKLFSTSVSSNHAKSQFVTDANSQQFSKANAVIDRIEGFGEVEKHSTAQLPIFHLS